MVHLMMTDPLGPGNGHPAVPTSHSFRQRQPLVQNYPLPLVGCPLTGTWSRSGSGLPTPCLAGRWSVSHLCGSSTFLAVAVLTRQAPVPPLRHFVAGLFTSFTCRLALALMGYWWIETDLVSPKRGKQTAIAQAVRSPMKGDLIIANWSSYVDVLYLAFRYNPTFVLPVFSPASTATRGSTGRHTGTGSANINNALPQPPLLGYVGVPLLAMLAKTGSLPETHSTPPKSLFKTLKDARMKCAGPVVLFPEATTGNGRAVLRFAEGTLLEEDIGTEGITWITYLRHSAPEAFAPSATCPLPQPLRHLLTSVLFTPTPIPRRSLTVRTLHPSASPSSPSFLPSEILANAPGGLEGAGKDGTGAWREAIATVLAETGRVRRVKGMGWVEKGAFLEYWNGRKR